MRYAWTDVPLMLLAIVLLLPLLYELTKIVLDTIATW